MGIVAVLLDMGSQIMYSTGSSKKYATFFFGGGGHEPMQLGIIRVLCITNHY